MVERPAVQAERPPTLTRSDTLRIAPIRRTTMSSDSWGLHSVPRVLSDFQRHTSHATHTCPDTTDGWSWFGSFPAFISLPTGLAAFNYHTKLVGPLGSLTLVMGLIMLMAGLLSLLNEAGQSKKESQKNVLKMAGALVCLLISSYILPLEWPCAAAVVAAGLGVSRTSVASCTTKASIMWLALVVAMALYGAVHDLSTLIGLTALGYAFYWLAFEQTSSLDPAVSITAGLVLVVFAIIRFVASFEVFFVGAIAGGALGVFLLVRQDILQTRYNAFACAAVACAVRTSTAPGSYVPIMFPLATVFLPTLGAPSTRTAAPSDRERSTWSLLDSILAHNDTRSIFYFFLLNFCFMLVQLLYSILSHSLGLLSDSIHMFFDCLALLMGLVASILAKVPPSARFPYGLALTETLSGFANGCLLLAISVGIVFESVERIYNPVQLEKMTELLIVSVCGLLVNVVGLFAFNHGHAHGHSHGPTHGHSHGHSHGHNRAPQSLDIPTTPYSHKDTGHDSHGSAHCDENMHGIFLHIMADTLGSVGVIISTVLTYYFGWSGFDAIASLIIAILIFASAIPLVLTSAKFLLLSLNDHQEYEIRDALNDISTTSGVTSYTVPKFWADGQGIRGTIHVQYPPGASSTHLRDKIESRLRQAGVDTLVIQMEEDGARCWCQDGPGAPAH